MGEMASQITSLTIVYLSVYSGGPHVDSMNFANWDGIYMAQCKRDIILMLTHWNYVSLQ